MKERFFSNKKSTLERWTYAKKRQKHSKDTHCVEPRSVRNPAFYAATATTLVPSTHIARFTFSIILDITPLQFQHEFLLNSPSALTYENIFIYLFIVQDAHRTMSATCTSHTILNICITRGKSTLHSWHTAYKRCAIHDTPLQIYLHYMECIVPLQPFRHIHCVLSRIQRHNLIHSD